MNTCVPLTTDEFARRLRAAYLEGFQDGVNHGEVPFRYPPPHIAWQQSDSRRGITGTAPPHPPEWYRNGVVTDLADAGSP